ncbi:hypothetical protein IFM5058_10397 [Aspergillus udagawae]|nr:hypothetical protein IFM5058_10397 [Aspergillus udagawae]
MAPRLSLLQVEIARDMILSKEPLTNTEIARVAQCSERSVTNIRRNLKLFGTPRAPENRVGRLKSITSHMLQVLCEHLHEEPGLYLDEMAVFLWNEFEIWVTTSSIRRALISSGWSKKIARLRAKERNAELRDIYLNNLSDFQSYHLVFVDESGCDKRIGSRRTGWSPLGVTPTQISRFHRDQRYQILPAYTQDGILLFEVFQGSTDAAVFESFIKRLLEHCGRWPQPKSVLIMDNASFHRSKHIEQMCRDAGVKLVYLPPYSPDLNPIEEFFAELKAYIKRNWTSYQEVPEQGFRNFLENCVETVGAKEQSARGHFRNSGIRITEE